MEPSMAFRVVVIPLDGGRMNECRLVLDTNVFVAAGFEPNSASARLLEALRQGRCRMIWHWTTRRETERVLRRIPPLDWHRFAPLFRPEWEHRAELDLTPFGAIEDPEDRKFAALAAATRSVLITNDDHLLARRDELPIRILKPGEFLAELMHGGADNRR
jgi:predicted nucleic acid-binding protein